MIPAAMLAQAAASDSAALAAAAACAEEALGCHREALAALARGWRSETGSTATELLQSKCDEAGDIVVELHRAAADLRSLHDGLANLSCSGVQAPPAEEASFSQQPGAETSNRPVGTPAPGPVDESPVPRLDPPAAVTGQSAAAAPWAAQAGPPAGTQAGPAWPPGGSIPALPDLGGALVGLVAQIAQTLGPYADTAGSPAAERSADHSADKPRPSDGPESDPPDHRPPKPRAPAPSPPASAIPKSIAPQSTIPAQTPAAAPPELLAAERLPDPGPPPAPAPPPVSAPVPPPTGPADASPPPAPPPATEAKTPCEIAADELPKVGE